MSGIPENPKSEYVPNVNPPIGTERRCPKCEDIKSIDEFYKEKKGTLRRQSYCISCKRKMGRKNPDCPERIKGIRSTSREYKAMWVLSHPDEAKERNRIAYKKLMLTSKGRINKNMSVNIRHSLKGSPKAGRSWQSLVGYNLDELRKHLEKSFCDGMTWENYGYYWHIDHIIPMSVFNYETPKDIDFKKCWGLKNLQPLEARKNLRKNAKINKPFQPSLGISI